MSSPQADTVGERIAALRELRGWTQKELAQRAEISVTFLSELENDRRDKMSSKILLRLADALGTTLDYLMKGVGIEPVSSEPVTIPPELASAAEAEGWSYADTIAFLRAQQSIVARRTRTGEIDRTKKALSREDWIALYNLFDHG